MWNAERKLLAGVDGVAVASGLLVSTAVGALVFMGVLLHKFPEGLAMPCAGRPGGDQIVAVLRRSPGVLAPGANPTVATGPLCAGTWQYTVVTQPNLDPLQVVTSGAPGSLTLVTAGTDVCTPEVRTGAPQGILSAAHC